jgi:hypothetical protein
MIRTDALRAGGGIPIDWPHAGDVASWVPLLATGNVGFVNERCGTYCIHSETRSSGFGIDVRLTDLRKLFDLIRNMLQGAGDMQWRRKIDLQCRRSLARQAFGIISSGRRQGATLVDLLPVIWRWRRELAGLGIGDAVALIRPLTLLLLPALVTRQLRRFVRMQRRWKSPNSEQRVDYQIRQGEL